jgi:hypothetical protein
MSSVCRLVNRVPVSARQCTPAFYWSHFPLGYHEADRRGRALARSSSEGNYRRSELPNLS